MKLKLLYTRRSFEHVFYYDIVYEWEDIIAKECNLSFYSIAEEYEIYKQWKKRWTRRLYRHAPFLRPFLLPAKYGLMYEMYPWIWEPRVNSEHIIPVIIDFFLTEEQIPAFFRSYQKSPLVLMTSREAYEYILTKENPYHIKFAHWALSLSDKYRIDKHTVFDKQYDVALVGRQNPVLEEFFYRYVKAHPDLRYVYRKMEDGDFNYYQVQNGVETFVGNINDRDDYMRLMRKSKIGLYMTPDIDTDHKRSCGFNQVTPRFLEWIAAGAHVIARYVPNPDTEYYRLQNFSEPIDTYEQFEKAMDYAMTHEVDMAMYSEYLSHHYTSVRAKELKQITENL